MRHLLKTFVAAAAVPVLMASASAQDGGFDTVPRLAVMSAFPPEWVALQGMLTEREEFEENGVEFITGKIEGEDVVLFLSGVGMVNAAMTTQLALNRFNIEGIVFSGIAGGVDPALDLGDVVVADQWGAYLYMVIAREAGDDWTVPPFFGKPFSNFGMMHTQNAEVRTDGDTEPAEKFWFEVDAALLARARSAAGTVTLKSCASEDNCLTEPPQVVVGGNGVSGDAYVDNAEFRTHVFDTFEAKVLDMESAAVAQVAYANTVPFIAFRSLSDLAGGGEAENEMGTFFNLAADNSAEMVRAFLQTKP